MESRKLTFLAGKLQSTSLISVDHQTMNKSEILSTKEHKLYSLSLIYNAGKVLTTLASGRQS